MNENNTASGNLVCFTHTSLMQERVCSEVKRSSGRMLTSALASFVKPDWLFNKGAMYFACCQDFCRECA